MTQRRLRMGVHSHDVGLEWARFFRRIDHAINVSAVHRIVKYFASQCETNSISAVCEQGTKRVAAFDPF